MIYIKRSRVAKPAVFETDQIKTLISESTLFYKQPLKNRAQKTFSHLSEKYLFNHIIAPLHDLFKGKCAYCEIGTKGIVDQFRPKRYARNLDMTADHDYYYWLAYDWKNLYYICPECNLSKGTWFPVAGGRAVIGTSYVNINNSERALLIDPCADFPAAHIEFNDETGEAVPLDEKGKVTIDILKLNRATLIRSRLHSIEDQKARINTYLSNGQKRPDEIISFQNELKKIFSGESSFEHLALRRNIIKKKFRNDSFIDSLTALEFPQIEMREVKFEIKKSLSGVLNTRSYINKIQITNFKKIKHFTFEFPSYESYSSITGETDTNDVVQAPWLVILGENGVGKSSILQAIAIGLSKVDYINSVLKPTNFVNEFSAKGEINLGLDNQNYRCVTYFDKKTGFKNLSDDSIVPNFSKGYGSVRLFANNKNKVEKKTKYVSFQNLFDHFIPIVNPTDFLLKVDNVMFDSTARILKLALKLASEDTFERKNGVVYLSRRGSKRSLDMLSDGYKSTISLIIDIIAFFSRSTKNFEDIQGIVLIDELELHLHPKWKMRFVESFRLAFPKIQVIATTHDPLCIKGLRKGEVIVLKENRKGETIAINDLPDHNLLTAEQLLTSEYFGLNSTIDPEIEYQFDQYYNLLSKNRKSLEEERRLDYLKDKLISKGQFGKTLRDEIMYKIIDEVIAEQFVDGRLKKREDLNKDALSIIKSQLFKKK